MRFNIYNRFRGIIIISLIFSINIVFSQNGNQANDTLSENTNIIRLSETKPLRNIPANNNSLVEVDYNFNGYVKAEKHISETNYSYLHIDGFAKLSEVGKPALPAHNDLVIIPSGESINIQITASSYTEYDNYNIHPALEAASDEEGAPEPQFEIDSQLYSTNAFYPENIVEIKEVQKIRGTAFAVVQIRPIQFNPVTKKIRVYNNIKYKAIFNGSKSSIESLSSSSSNNYLNSLRSTFLNKEVLPKASTTKSGSTSKEYIIISTTAYADAANSLAKWKRQLGYSVDVCLSSSWTSAQVKDSIHTKYANWTPKPDYFVIIGDHADVPAQVIGSYGSDLYYACMDGAGDYVPDMAHGRISVSSVAEANSVVEKIVNYEKNPVTDPSFYQTSANCAYFQDGSDYTSYFDGYADRRFLHTSEEVRDYMLNLGYNVNRVYEAFDNRNPQYYNNGYYSNGQPLPSDLLVSNGFNWTAGANEISSEINAGRFMLIHRDHGYTGGYGWAHPQYVNIYNHINNLSNGNKLPVVFSINCHTGDFLQAECFAENFLRKSNGGAVGVIAPSYTSYSGYNDAALVGMIDAMWSNPGLIPDFGFGGVSNPTLNPHGDILTMGDIMNQGLLRMTQTWNSSTKWQTQHEIYHYFGDPAMKIWTAVPTQITANLPDTLQRFSNSISISNVNLQNATATLIINGELVDEIELVNGSGILNFNISDTATALITLSGTNHRIKAQKVFIRNNIVNQKPSVQARNIAFNTQAKTSDLTVNWENGDGDFRLLMINNNEQFTDPIDGQEYQADDYFQNNGQQVVYNGEGNTATIYGLDEGVTYWFRVYEYNNEGIYTLYATFQETNNPNNPDESSTILPVELIYFDAINKDNNAIISWETASEKNNNFFTLEKSINGYDYHKIAIIDGAGTKSNSTKYNYSDALNSEKTYYRLSQTDFDGKTEVFSPIVVFGNSSSAFEITNVNSDNNKADIYFSAQDFERLEISILDISGRKISENIQANNSKSNYKTSFDISNLNAGIYLVSIDDGQRKAIRKFIIQ